MFNHSYWTSILFLDAYFNISATLKSCHASPTFPLHFLLPTCSFCCVSLSSCYASPLPFSLACIWQVNEIAITIHQVSLDYFAISSGGGVRLRSSSSSSWKGVATPIFCLLPPALPDDSSANSLCSPFSVAALRQAIKWLRLAAAAAAAAPVGTAPATASVSAKWVATRCQSQFDSWFIARRHCACHTNHHF